MDIVVLIKNVIMRPKQLTFKNSKYEKFIKSKPCLICGRMPVQLHHIDHARWNVFMLAPLCMEHHMPGFKDSYHQLERSRFEDKHSLNLDWEVMRLLMEYINEQ